LPDRSQLGRNIGSILGNGNDIVFWKEKWCGVSSLSDFFPSFFQKLNTPVGVYRIWGLGFVILRTGSLIGSPSYRVKKKI
jgi:hypothetical protein